MAEEVPETGQADVRAYLERIYENERLTDNLTDDAARLLLTWGEQKLKQLAEAGYGAADIERAAHQVEQVMYSINRLAAERAELSEVEFIQRLLNLLDQATQNPVHSTEQQECSYDQKTFEFP